MSKSYFHRVAANTPTEFWINNVTRREAQLAVEAGAIACTQNPTYPWKILNRSEDAQYANELLDKIIKQESDDNMALTILQKELVANICEIFMPIFEKSGGKQGWVSIQGDPFSEDVENIVKFARINREAGANVIAKIPVTKEGLEAMRILIKEGTPILATEVMAIDQAIDLGELYKKETEGVENPPVMIFAHIAGIFDEHLQHVVKKQGIEVDQDALWQAGVTVAKKIHQHVINKKYGMGFLSGGARGLHHYTEMVGAQGGITINWIGSAEELIKNDPPVVQRFISPTSYDVIDELSEKLEVFRKAYTPKSLSQEEYEHFGPVVLFRNNFEEGWRKALECVKQRRSELG